MTMSSKSTQSPTNGLDLAVFDQMQKAQEEGIDVPIRGPDGKDLGFSIKIAGPDSERQRRAIDTIRDERLQSMDPTPLTAEQIGHQNIRGIALATISWTPFKLDGMEPPCTENQAIALYKRFPFIREQVEAKAGSRASFIRHSSGDSSNPSAAGSTS